MSSAYIIASSGYSCAVSCVSHSFPCRSSFLLVSLFLLFVFVSFVVCHPVVEVVSGFVLLILPVYCHVLAVSDPSYIIKYLYPP